MDIPARALTVLVALALITAACGDDGSGTTVTSGPSTTIPGTTPPTGEIVEARSDLERADSTDVTEEELAALVAGNSAFAFELFRLTAAQEQGNALISPYSIAAALTMTYAAARGITADEMRDVLSLALPDERLHAARNELDLRITNPPEPPADDEREPFEISVANSLWGQAGYPFLPEFLDLLAQNYDAGMNLVDFQTAAEEARVQINEWVAEQTNGRIEDLIPQGALDELTRLVLVNAIWFKASWAEQFDPDRTAPGTFTTLDGSSVTVPMMHGGGRFLYAEGDGYVITRIPYAGDAAMVVVLPHEGRFEEVAASFGPEMLAGLATGGVFDVNLTMPRFEFRTDLAVGPILRQMGMEAAFEPPFDDSGADFTGMSELRELYVSSVIHQAFIKVDEEGTEAAAATAVVIGTTSQPEVATVTLDRPFLFVIEHSSTGEPLFIGQVLNPAA